MRNLRIACVSSFNDLNQQEVSVKQIQPGIVEYVTETQKKLIVDLVNPDLQAYLEPIIGAALVSAGLQPDFPADGAWSREQGQTAVQTLLLHVAQNPAPTPAMKVRWDNAWQNDCLLSTLLLETSAAMCRERAIVMHILLAVLGIPTRVIRASDAHHNGHSWVVYDDLATGRPELGFDPAHRAIYRASVDDDPMLGAVYPRHVQWFRIVEPEVRNAALLDRNPDWVCLPDLPQ